MREIAARIVHPEKRVPRRLPHITYSDTNISEVCCGKED